MSRQLKNILCIDDECDILEVAKICLETVGNFNVTTCASGEEALKKINTIKPDLILMDVMMPEMDGPTTLKKLKDSHLIDSIPVVFMTARVQPTDIEGYLKLGVTAVIQKPFDPMILPGELTEIFEGAN